MTEDKKGSEETPVEEGQTGTVVPGDYPEGKDKKGVDPLPHCRTAPDPEHLRADNEDEPCDDYRSGDISSDDEE